MRLKSLLPITLLLTQTGFGQAPPAERPNILYCIMDDAGMHMGAYGVDWVKTPAFDRMAKEGILFQSAYTPNAKCAPSRANVLTGRNSWQLGPIGVHVAVWPKGGYKSYVEALAEHGYAVGMTGKGWGPGIIEDGAPRDLTGTPYNSKRKRPPARGMSQEDYAANFEDFLNDVEDGQPWSFWYGAREPHRRYQYGSGISVGGKDPAEIDAVPAFWPDNETVRTDMLDYAFEIEHADRHLGEMMGMLEERGQLENTLIVFTSDNGMPFPGAKGFQYEYSTHMPLAIMWQAGIRNPGRVEDGYVSFVDFAPTFLKVAGVDFDQSGMEPTSGKDLVEIFEDGYRKHDRSYVILGQERHDYGRPDNQGYPLRSIISDGHLYIHAFKPDLWPAGNPETGYLNTDGSPTKTAILNLRREGVDTQYLQFNFGKRPQEQLYHIAVDRECLVNLADAPQYAALKASLKAQLFRDLAAQGDPRVAGPDGDIFDRYPFAVSRGQDFYERYMAGDLDASETNWVEPTDYEPAPLDQVHFRDHSPR